MKNLFTLILIMIISPVFVFAQSVMSSGEYKMQSDSLNFAGLISSSTTYQMSDTLGESASGQIDSSTYLNYLGFQYMGFADPDTEDPTAPVSLTADVVSSSEIELTWSEATDNISVDRYSIYRDGTRIDNVTSFPRSFNDTGLTANTTYSYNVSAVDDSNNESLWSGTTTATTLSTSSSLLTGGSRTVFITNFTITSNDTNAVINFQTSLPRVADIYYGLDTTYGEGMISGILTQNHNIVLNNLTPNTFYQVKVVLRDEYGNGRSFENISFRTLRTSLSTAPVNVYSFNAMNESGVVRLSWLRPTDTKVVGFTIVRSDIAYPNSISDGRVIYRGSGSSYLDTESQVGRDYFYTIFTEDLAGNISSGVVTNIRIPISNEEIVDVSSPLERLKDAKSVDPLIERLAIDDFLFIQRGDSVDVSKGLISISEGQNTTIAIKYYRLPTILKTIAVTLTKQDGGEGNFTFILRPNRDKTRYEATIGPLSGSAGYKIRIDIVDYKNQGLKTLFGEVRINPVQVDTTFAFDIKLVSIILGSALGLLLVGVLIFKAIMRRRLPLIDVSRGALNVSPK